MLGNGGYPHGAEYEVRTANDDDLYITGVQWASVPEDSGYMPPHNEAHANARLIAAAPELLEALEICLAVAKRPLEKMLNVNGETPYDIGLAAVRKARGQ